MDRPVEQKRFTTKKIRIGTAIFLSAGLLLYFVVRSNSITHTINLSKIKTNHVRLGDFQEQILVSGTAEPITSILLDAKEGGVIQEILVEDGAIVEAGDPLLILTNETVMFDFMQRETQVVEQINNLRNTRIALYQNQRRTEDQLVDLQKELVLIQRQFQIDSGLFSEHVISSQDYFKTKTQFEYIQKKVSIEQERIAEDLNYKNVQIRRIDESLLMMERNLSIIKHKLENLMIRAPKSGELNSFTHEIGEVLNRNALVGRIDNTSEYRIQAGVDQHYLKRIRSNQQAYVKVGGRTYPMIVKKVFPTIETGQFRIDLHFVSKDSLPTNLRRGQSFQVFIEANAQKKALILEKGSFFKSSGGQFVYVFDRENHTAQKRRIKLGAQNPYYYEVIEGLQEGDEIIISSYDHYNQWDKITVNE